MNADKMLAPSTITLRRPSGESDFILTKVEAHNNSNNSSIDNNNINNNDGCEDKTITVPFQRPKANSASCITDGIRSSHFLSTMGAYMIKHDYLLSPAAINVSQSAVPPSRRKNSWQEILRRDFKKFRVHAAESIKGSVDSLLTRLSNSSEIHNRYSTFLYASNDLVIEVLARNDGDGVALLARFGKKCKKKRQYKQRSKSKSPVDGEKWGRGSSRSGSSGGEKLNTELLQQHLSELDKYITMEKLRRDSEMENSLGNNRINNFNKYNDGGVGDEKYKNNKFNNYQSKIAKEELSNESYNKNSENVDYKRQMNSKLNNGGNGENVMKEQSQHPLTSNKWQLQSQTQQQQQEENVTNRPLQNHFNQKQLQQQQQQPVTQQSQQKYHQQLNVLKQQQQQRYKTFAASDSTSRLPHDLSGPCPDRSFICPLQGVSVGQGRFKACLPLNAFPKGHICLKVRGYRLEIVQLIKSVGGSGRRSGGSSRDGSDDGRIDSGSCLENSTNDICVGSGGDYVAGGSNKVIGPGNKGICERRTFSGDMNLTVKCHGDGRDDNYDSPKRKISDCTDYNYAKNFVSNNNNAIDNNIGGTVNSETGKYIKYCRSNTLADRNTLPNYSQSSLRFSYFAPFNKNNTCNITSNKTLTTNNIGNISKDNFQNIETIPIKSNQSSRRSSKNDDIITSASTNYNIAAMDENSISGYRYLGSVSIPIFVEPASLDFGLDNCAQWLKMDGQLKGCISSSCLNLDDVTDDDDDVCGVDDDDDDVTTSGNGRFKANHRKF